MVVVWRKAGGWHSGQAERSTRHITLVIIRRRGEGNNKYQPGVVSEDQLDRWRTRTSTQEGPGPTSSLVEPRLARPWLRSDQEVAGDPLRANNH